MNKRNWTRIGPGQKPPDEPGFYWVHDFEDTSAGLPTIVWRDEDGWWWFVGSDVPYECSGNLTLREGVLGTTLAKTADLWIKKVITA